MFKESGFKSDRYAKKGESDGIDALSDKLSLDLRKSIKSLGSYSVLSESWCEMSDIFGRIAQISDTESKLAQPKSGSSAATLWETEEQALRYLIEDGKLNLCLRNLVEFKDFQRKTWLTKEPIELGALEKCENFERGLGTVLRNAWTHSEALQTTDMSGLMDYICDVLDTANDFPTQMSSIFHSPAAPQHQEVMVFYYLSTIFSNLDKVAENTITGILRSRRAFINGARLLATYHTLLPRSQVSKVAEALSLIAACEDFNTYFNEYVSGRDEAELLGDLKVKCLAVFATDMEARRMLRPLSDAVDKAQRKYKKK